MGRSARLTRPISAIGATQAARPATMAELMAVAQTTERLDALTGVFSGMIAGLGFSEHFCLEIDEDGALTPLFGDAAALPDNPASLLLGVQSWHEGALYLLLAGRCSPIDRATRAKLQGWAEVYASFGMALLERERDIPTSVGLGLAQRQCLAQLLVGRPEYAIADTLGLTPLAVRGHIESAIRFLGVGTRAEAISLAARRGWLAGLDQCAPAALTHRAKIHG